MRCNRAVLGLTICALALVALVGPGHAAEATIQANAAIKGEGRLYKATDNLLLFSGYFQGAINVTNQQGDLSVNAASLTCPATLEVNTTTKTQQGEGRCLILTQDGTHVYGRWTCTGKPGEGCGGTFTVVGGTGKFSTTSGQGEMMLTTTLVELETEGPGGGRDRELHRQGGVAGAEAHDKVGPVTRKLRPTPHRNRRRSHERQGAWTLPPQGGPISACRPGGEPSVDDPHAFRRGDRAQRSGADGGAVRGQPGQDLGLGQHGSPAGRRPARIGLGLAMVASRGQRPATQDLQPHGRHGGGRRVVCLRTFYTDLNGLWLLAEWH